MSSDSRKHGSWKRSILTLGLLIAGVALSQSKSFIAELDLWTNADGDVHYLDENFNRNDLRIYGLVDDEDAGSNAELEALGFEVGSGSEYYVAPLGSSSETPFELTVYRADSDFEIGSRPERAGTAQISIGTRELIEGALFGRRFSAEAQVD